MDGCFVEPICCECASSLGDSGLECCPSSTQKIAPCAFAQVLAKTDPLSAGLRTNARSEGHGQLFLASGFTVTDASAENIDAQGGAAFHLTTLMVEWPESGSNFGGGSKNNHNFLRQKQMPSSP